MRTVTLKPFYVINHCFYLKHLWGIPLEMNACVTTTEIEASRHNCIPLNYITMVANPPSKEEVIFQIKNRACHIEPANYCLVCKLLSKSIHLMLTMIH